jgi:type II secretory pathway pseudopilin PulG
VVIAIISFLTSVVLVSLSGSREQAHEARAEAEYRTFETAIELYRQDHGGYPADVNRDIPSGLEGYLNMSRWPDAPWPDSLYDWDNWDINGEDVIQLSIRFCEMGQPSTCNFPNTEWAKNFDVYSAAYFCIEGDCRSHSSKPKDHPGYCLNCQ